MEFGTFFLITIIILLNTSWCGLLDEASTHWTIKPIPRLTIIITVWKPGAILWIWHISWTYWERLARHRAGLINPPEDHLRLIETLWLVHMNRQCTFCDMRQDIELYGLASLNSARVVFFFASKFTVWICGFAICFTPPGYYTSFPICPLLSYLPQNVASAVCWILIKDLYSVKQPKPCAIHFKWHNVQSNDKFTYFTVRVTVLQWMWPTHALINW